MNASSWSSNANKKHHSAAANLHDIEKEAPDQHVAEPSHRHSLILLLQPSAIVIFVVMIIVDVLLLLLLLDILRQRVRIRSARRSRTRPSGAEPERVCRSPLSRSPAPDSRPAARSLPQRHMPPAITLNMTPHSREAEERKR